MKTVALEIPDPLYDRLEKTAQATQKPLDAIVLRALEVGAPPSLDNIPPEFHADLAELEGLDDNALFAIATARQTPAEFARHEALLVLSSRTIAQQRELDELRFAADRLMLRKAHAAALLRWRGRIVPAAA